ncbi:MAG: hypothetical protein K8S56_00050 [Candidatus Cloacimonetes bacterium]|nr:hypothetical protein [Candidatus Cloacimonadota bacterium]
MKALKEISRQFPAIRKLYHKLWHKTPYSWRLGKEFWCWYTLYNESETWSIEEIESTQLNFLKELLYNASKCLYYAPFLRDVNIDKLDSPDCLKDIFPVTDRNTYLSNYKTILSPEYKKFKRASYATSGTTGLALQYYHRFDESKRESAAIFYQWKRVGFIPGKTVKAEFRGLTDSGNIQHISGPNSWRYNILDFSSEAVKTYSTHIRNRNIKFFHAYPSALYLLCHTINKYKIPFPQPEAIMLASENVYDWQLNLIEKVFPEAKIIVHYGCAEHVVLGAWCEHRRSYHCLPLYSVVETDPQNGTVIGTNLHNPINPFIRYRMSDVAKISKERTCSQCKRPLYPLIDSVEGREEEYLYSPEKGFIPPAIVTYPLKRLHYIKEMQFVQNTETTVTIRYLLHEPVNIADINDELAGIKQGLQRLMGNAVIFDFVQVEGFERGLTGKFKWIISSLQPE